VRQWLAALLAAAGAFFDIKSQIWLIQNSTEPYELDPSPLFYVAAAIGLALRAFWARYLAICFAAAIITVKLFWFSDPIAPIAVRLAFILLLSGASMRSLFEESAGGQSRWARNADERIGRLRLLFVAQAVALALIWAPGDHLSPIARPLAIAAGLVLAGLVLQQTWAALLVVPVVGLELYLASRSFGVRVHWGLPPAWSYPATLVATSILSLVVVSPFLRGFVRKLIGERASS
jgi:hypothetical protein